MSRRMSRVSCLVGVSPRVSSRVSSLVSSRGHTTGCRCSYEVFVSLGLTRAGGLHRTNGVMHPYKWDVYTAASDIKDMDGRPVDAVGICEWTVCDEDYGPYKQRRERWFPFELTCSALDIRLENAEASVGADRVHILNKMTDAADLNAPLLEMPPPEVQSKYDELNGELRASFAASSLPRAFEEGGPVVQRFLASLAAGRMQTLSFDFSECEAFSAALAKDLIDHIPASVTTLNLLASFAAKGPDVAVGLADGLRANAWLTDVDLRQNNMGAEGWCSIFDALAGSTVSKINKWELMRDLTGGEQIGPQGAKSLGVYLAASHSLTSLE